MSAIQPKLLVPSSHKAPGHACANGHGLTSGDEVDPVAGASTGSTWAHPAVTTRNRGRLRLRRLAVALALVAVAVGAYLAVTRLGRSSPKQDIKRFKVTRRSFPIVLQEKGELRADNTNDIRSELEGRATIISLIDEGAYVKKGDKLIELASNEIDEKIRDAEIRVATAKADYEAAVKGLQILVEKNASEIRKAGVTHWLAEQALKKYQEGEAVKSRQDAELSLEKATSLLKQAREKRQDSEELFKKEYITKYDLEQDRLSESSAEIELKTANLALKILNDYTIPMDIAEKQSKIDDAAKDLNRAKKEAEASEAKDKAFMAAKESELKLNQDKLVKLQDQKAKAMILAPADGLVVYSRENRWDSEGRIKPGAQVFERQKLLELPDTSTMKVKIRVHEAKAERLKLGLPATVEIEGLSGRQFTGKVSKIAALADTEDWMNQSVKEYRTEVMLDGKFTDLKPNTSATVEILVTELKDVLAVPIQAVFSKGDRQYVFLDDNGDLRPAEVQVGLSSIEFVEIKEGLKEGQMVRLAVSDEAKLKLPDGNGKEKPKKVVPTTQPASRPASQPATAGNQPAVSATRPSNSSASSRPVVKTSDDHSDGASTRPAAGA